MTLSNFRKIFAAIFIVIAGLAFISGFSADIPSYAQDTPTATPSPSPVPEEQLPQEGDPDFVGPTSQSTGNTGIQAFQILPFDCLIGCDDGLLDAIQSFLVALAPGLAAIVIAWGGYLYFFGGINGKSDGRQAISAGVIGLAVVLLAGQIVRLIGGDENGNGALINDNGFNTSAIEALFLDISGLLVGLASVIAVVVIIWGGYQFLFSSVPGAKGDGKQTIINGIIGLVVIILASQIIGFVEGVTDVLDPEVTANINDSALVSFIVNITNFILIPVSAAVTVFFIILGGYQYITAKETFEVSNARKSIRNALIGFVIVLLAVTIVQTITYFVGTL